MVTPVILACLIASKLDPAERATSNLLVEAGSGGSYKPEYL